MTALLLLATLTAEAAEPQYRDLRLEDGRDMIVEVIASVENGLWIRTPWGIWQTPYDQIRDMQPVEHAAYINQDPLKVWIYAPDHRDAVIKSYSKRSKIEVLNAEHVGEETIAQLEACEADLDCMNKAMRPFDWAWMVTVMPPSDSREADLVVRARPSTGKRVNVVDTSAKELWDASRRAIEIVSDNPEDLFKMTNDVPRANLEDPGKIFVPVPGYTALERGRPGTFALAIGGATVSSGLVAAAMYKADADMPQTTTATLATFCTVGLISNYLATRR